MLSPTAVVAATMDAMQRNDYPDTDAGVKTAFLFSKPDGVEGLIASQVNFLSRCGTVTLY